MFQLCDADVVSQDTDVQMPKSSSIPIIPTLGVTPEKKELECSSRLLPELSSTPTISEVTTIAEVKNPESVPTGGSTTFSKRKETTCTLKGLCNVKNY